MKLNWQTKLSTLDDVSQNKIQPFLVHKASLTQLIQEHCPGQFNVQLIDASWQMAQNDELELLSLTDNISTFIRKSLLKCDDKTIVYARTVIPEQTLTGKNKKLVELGDKPLGDFLFSDATTYRSDIRYAKIPVNTELHNEATTGCNITAELWARQSLIFIAQQPLAITEIFLPSILEYS